MSRPPGRQRVTGTVAAILAVALAGGTAPASATSTSPAASASPAGDVQSTVIDSGDLSVRVAEDFPRVLGYTDRDTGARLGGSTEPVDSVTLNGTAYAVEAVLDATDEESAHYTLTFEDLPGVELEASLSVHRRVTTFRIEEVRDTGEFRVGTIDIPGHDLVSVDSDRPGAATAFTTLDPDSTTTADRFTQLTGETPVDEQPVGASYALVNNDELAAAVESNSSYDRPSGETRDDGARFWHQARKDEDGSVRVGVWSGQWTYRGDGAPAPEQELPWAKVVVTPDANGDGTVDWQDGAVAFRDTIATETKGGEQTPDRVIAHIPFNFASQATHPFLRTLDDVKRISLATDGLGQFALLKGYAGEGHDTVHPDYGGNYNHRASGLEGLNKLVKAGEKWGATFGVHVNATESYPDANNFSEKLVDEDRPGWNWLNQSYYIDQRRDLNSGDLLRRFQQLRDEAHPNLSMLYIDVYYTSGWIADRTASELNKQGWVLSTEWSDRFERSSVWSHWANDLDYGGKTNKGLNSQIIRFIRNDEKDVWNDHPILGHTALVDFEGWTGENDYDAFYDNIWERNLPAKFLQHYDITDWEQHEITFTGGVRGTDANGEREVFLGDAKVIDGDSYLLPWSSQGSDEHDKLYHWSRQGGSSTWRLPESFAGAEEFTVYRLTDNGRVQESVVKAVGGEVTLQAEAGQPYVLYPGQASEQAGPEWGQGTEVKDPGFNDIGLDAWQKTGPVSGERDGLGRRGAVLGGGEEAALEQRIAGLTPGERYSASAFLEVEPGKTRRTTLSIGGESVTLDRSTAKNYVAADERHGTYYQRVKVHFTAPAGGATTLRISAGGDSGARVGVDDVRIVQNEPVGKDGAEVFEDFEDVDQGWGPFVKGDAGGSTDPRTHLAQEHAPYTQSGWNGKLVDDVLGGEESLKSHGENTGLVYRTVPWTVPFQDGHAYRVEFDYQSSHAGAYQWVTGYDTVAGGEPTSVETRATPVQQQRTTGRFSETVVGGCGDVWTGLRKLGSAPENADFVLDDFTVTDLGPADEALACATLDMTSRNDALEPGFANEVESAFTNHEASAAEGVELTLDVPEGWQAEPVGATTFDSVAPGAKATATWNVTPPADAEYRSYALGSEAAYRVGGEARSVAQEMRIRTLAPPPTVDTWASDMDWVSAENGWGPVEKDMSNGGTGSGDGEPMSIGGVAFEKGLGTHAPADVRYYLGGQCETFTAEVGVDDAQPTRGSVRFSVVADGETVAESPVLRASDGAYALQADISGAKYVHLVVGDAGDGIGNDHASWGGARWHCA